MKKLTKIKVIYLILVVISTLFSSITYIICTAYFLGCSRCGDILGVVTLIASGLFLCVLIQFVFFTVLRKEKFFLEVILLYFTFRITFFFLMESIFLYPEFRRVEAELKSMQAPKEFSSYEDIMEFESIERMTVSVEEESGVASILVLERFCKRCSVEYQYSKGSYRKVGVSTVWHSTAIFRFFHL